MEMLAATVISLVAPYLAKGAEEFAKSVGKEASEGVKAIFTRLQRWWSGDPVASAAANALPDSPERNGKFLSECLADALAKDEQFAAELRRLVEDMGPQVEVVQKIEIARGVTGADIGHLSRGVVKVDQDIGEADNVTGFRADKVGG